MEMESKGKPCVWKKETSGMPEKFQDSGKREVLHELEI